jgi:N-acetylglucosamine kinase-like BadF-type ATPase
MGDEGSAYDLGRRALVAAARAVDGRGPETTLLPAIISHFRKSSLWEVRSLVYEGKIDRAGIAQLARLVVQAAQGGDPAASALLEEGALALSEIAWAVLARLKLDKGETPVVPVGGLFQAGSLLWDPFSIYLRKRAPRVRIVSPLYQPVIGALLLAFKAGGLAIDAPLHDQLRLADQQLGSKEGSTP